MPAPASLCQVCPHRIACTGQNLGKQRAGQLSNSCRKDLFSFGGVAFIYKARKLAEIILVLTLRGASAAAGLIHSPNCSPASSKSSVQATADCEIQKQLLLPIQMDPPVSSKCSISHQSNMRLVHVRIALMDSNQACTDCRSWRGSSDSEDSTTV